MIPQDELDKAIEIAEKYNIGKMYLIGSSLYKEPSEVNDYDFAVADIPSGNFFKFYGELLRAMPKAEVEFADVVKSRHQIDYKLRVILINNSFNKFKPCNSSSTHTVHIYKRTATVSR